MEVCPRSSVVLSFGGGIGWGGGRGRCGATFPGEEGSQESYLHGEDRKNFKNEDGALYSHVLPGETVCKSDAKHSLPTRAMDVCRGLHLP